MGTRYSAVFIAAVDIDLRPVHAALQSAVDAVDRQMSNWLPASDVSRLNAAETGTWVAVIETGLEIGRRSGGAFDIGLGQVVDAWGFGPTRSKPDAASIRALPHADKRSSAEMLEIDRRNCRIRKHASLQVDLCGIAKGFGVDQLARSLDAHGIGNYLVSIDGELRAKGQRPDGGAWNVAIEAPTRFTRSPATAIGLQDRAIATSGDYRHWHDHNGRLISHTMDPCTGGPLDTLLASVSVIAANAMTADAWATALLVAGADDGPAMAEVNGLDAMFMLRNGNNLLELRVGTFR
jgi:thiamine biosynthesis lipoprotein